MASLRTRATRSVMGKATVCVAGSRNLSAIARQALSRLDDIGEVSGLACCPGRDPEGTANRITALAPDLVLLDAGSPALDGLEVARKLVRTSPATRVVAFCKGCAEDDHELLEVIRSGAVARLHVEEPMKEHTIARTIRQVCAGDYPLAEAVRARPSLARLILNEFRQTSSTGPLVKGAVSALTREEEHLLTAIADGISHSQLAGELAGDEQTSRNRVGCILRKLVAKDQARCLAKCNASLAMRLALAGNLLILDSRPRPRERQQCPPLS